MQQQQQHRKEVRLPFRPLVLPSAQWKAESEQRSPENDPGESPFSSPETADNRQVTNGTLFCTYRLLVCCYPLNIDFSSLIPPPNPLPGKMTPMDESPNTLLKMKRVVAAYVSLSHLRCSDQPLRIRRRHLAPEVKRTSSKEREDEEADRAAAKQVEEVLTRFNPEDFRDLEFEDLYQLPKSSSVGTLAPTLSSTVAPASLLTQTQFQPRKATCSQRRTCNAGYISNRLDASPPGTGTSWTAITSSHRTTFRLAPRIERWSSNQGSSPAILPWPSRFPIPSTSWYCRTTR